MTTLLRCQACGDIFEYTHAAAYHRLHLMWDHILDAHRAELADGTWGDLKMSELAHELSLSVPRSVAVIVGWAAS